MLRNSKGCPYRWRQFIILAYARFAAGFALLLEFASEAILYFFISLLGDLGEKILSFAEVTGDAIRSSKIFFYIFRLFMTKSGY